MAEYRHILVPVDGSASSLKAVEQAIELAGLCDSEINFIHVANLNGVMGSYPAFVSPRSNFSGSILEDVVEIGRKILDQALDMVPQSIKAKGHCVNGNPASAILQEAEALKVDLIIVGSRGLGVLRGTLVGSVSRSLLGNATCPVLVVKAEEQK